MCQFQKDTLFSHIQLNLHYKYIIKPYRLKLSCTIPSTYLQLEGFRNYIATIQTKSPQRYPLLARLGHSTVSVCQLSLSFSVHLSVLSACCVFILLHSVSLCSVVFLYSLSVTFCLPVHLLRGHFSVWGFVRPEVLSLCCIKASSSYYILRCSHILYWGFVLIVIYWGYVPMFETLVLVVVGPYCFCLYCLCGLSAVICVWFCFCLYFSIG